MKARKSISSCSKGVSHLCSGVQINRIEYNNISHIRTENAVGDSERARHRFEYQCSAIDESCEFADQFTCWYIYNNTRSRGLQYELFRFGQVMV